MISNATEGASVIAGLRQAWPDFELELTNYNLVNPTSDIAIKFYERFICGQLQIEIEGLQERLIEQASCPQAFKDILSTYALYMCTKTVIEKLGLIELIQTFGLTDLLKPMRKKFKMSLILVSNCVLYATVLQELMDDIKNKMLQDLQSTKDIRDQIENVKEKINHAVIAHMKNQQKKDDWRCNKDFLLKQIQVSQDDLERIQEERKYKKIELNEIQKEYEILSAKLNDSLALEEKLKCQIVDDHESLLCERDRLIKEKNLLLAESVEFNDIMNQKMQTICCYQENLNYIKQFLETIPLNKVLEKYDIINKCNNEIEQHQNQIKMLQEDESLSVVALNEIKDSNDCLEQKIYACSKQHNEKMKHSHKQLEDLQNDVKLEQDKMSKSLELSEKLDKKIQHLNECSREYEQNIQTQNTYYDEKYKEILELKGQLDNKVMSTIETLEDQLNSK